MVKRLILVFICLSLFVLPFVYSASNTFTFTEGYKIVATPQTYVTYDENYTINFFVYNESNGKPIDNSSTNCSFYLANSNGDLLFSDTVDYITSYWKVEILKGNLTNNGYFPYGIYCYSNLYGGTTTGYLETTYNGYALDISNAILYISMFLIYILFMGVVLFFINKLPSSNERDEEGKIMSISYLKYLRSTLWFAEWMLVVLGLYISSNLAFNFLGEQLFANSLFTLFRISFGITPIVVIVWIAWIFTSMFHDKQFQNMLNRGIFPQGRL